MKIDIASDMHLVFGGYDRLVGIENEGSDVLILAGDIVEVTDLKGSGTYRTQVMDYLGGLNSRYKKVIFVAGNHEHYRNSFRHTNQNLKSRFTEFGLGNFVVLENETIEVDDVIFFGATMWSTMRNNNPIVVMDCAAFMNDYQEIKIEAGESKYVYGDWMPLQPEHTIAECRNTLRHIRQFALLETDKKKVLVTHHAPSVVSISEKYKTSNVNDAYFEEISNTLFESDIKFAIHGHCHTPVNYMIGNCHVISNPRGYYGSETQAYSYRFKQIEV